MSITLSVTVTKSADGVAPLLVHFDASASTSTSASDSFRDIEYYWDFGDPGGGPIWSYGQHTDRNTAKGPQAAHCYLSPGTYTVTLTTVTDGTTTLTNQSFTGNVITVTDPSVANGWTITCVNPVGDADFSAAPTGAAHVNNNSFSSAVSTYAQTAKSRCLFKGGSTFTADPRSTDSGANIGNTSGPGIVGSYGTGKAHLTVNSAPISASNAFLFLFGSDDWRAVDFSITNPSHYRTGIGCCYGFHNNFLLLNIDATKCSQMWHWASGPGAALHGIVNCSSNDSVHWDSGGTKYVMYIEGISKQVVLGSLFQGPQSNYAGLNYLNHNTRFQTQYNSVITNSRWEYGVVQSPNTNTYTNGTCFWHGGASPNPATKIHFYDCEIDENSGGTGPSIGAQNTGTNESINNFIADTIYGHSDAITQWWSVNSGASLITVRNTAVYIAGAGDAGQTFIAKPDVGAASPAPDTIRFINNTIYAPNATTADGPWFTATMASAGLIANNLVYAPNYAGSTVTSVTNATASNNVTSGQVNGSNPNFLNGTTTYSKITDFKLNAGSYAIGLGTSATAVSDLTDAAGTVWTTSARDLGAFQYGSGGGGTPTHRGGRELGKF